jgi:hypothetical protein
VSELRSARADPRTHCDTFPPKVLHIVALYGKYTRVLTFEDVVFVSGIMIYYPCLLPRSDIFLPDTLKQHPPAPAHARAGGMGVGGRACLGVGGVGGWGEFGGGRGGVLTDDVLRNLVPVRKDVEALSFWYQEALYQNIRSLDGLPRAMTAPYAIPPPGSKALVPCAPYAVVKILEAIFFGAFFLAASA